MGRRMGPVDLMSLRPFEKYEESYLGSGKEGDEQDFYHQTTDMSTEQARYRAMITNLRSIGLARREESTNVSLKALYIAVIARGPIS